MEIYGNSNRIGRMLLLHDVLQDESNRPWLKALFALCLPLEILDHESGRGKEYICSSDLFDPLRQGEEIPEYRIECELALPFTEEENRRATASGPFKFYAVRKIIVRVPVAQIGTRPLRSNLH